MHHEVVAPLAVRVSGLSLADVTPDVVPALRQLLADHGVLVFPRQDDVDDEVCAAFLRDVGDLAAVHAETRSDGCHSYRSSSRAWGRTADCTALRAGDRPAARAVFIDQYGAFETLPADVRDWLLGRTVRRADPDRSTGGETVREHPVFVRHPVSGRIALQLSLPSRGTGITGLPADVAEATMTYLLEHARAHGRTFEHTWAAGDVLVWDNHGVLHTTERDAA